MDMVVESRGSGLLDASLTVEVCFLLHLKALAACDNFSILGPQTCPYFFMFKVYLPLEH